MAMAEPEMMQRGGAAAGNPAAVESPEPAGPGREELTCAAEAVLSLVKVAKALRIYLPNNPMLIKFVGEAMGKMTAQIPLGRLGKSEELGAAICFLCSDGAGFVTGHVLPHAGGWA